MEKYKLYWDNGSANMVVHAVLREINADVQFIQIDLDKEEQKSSAYIALNPHARVPTLVYDSNKIIYESVAIVQFLTERHPETKLAPSLESVDRGPYLQWMAYLNNTFQEALEQYWHANNFIDGQQHQTALITTAIRRADHISEFINQHLAKHGPYLCGHQFYACDYFLAMIMYWIRLADRPAKYWPHIDHLLKVVIARPAYQQMLKEECIEQTVLSEQ